MDGKTKCDINDGTMMTAAEEEERGQTELLILKDWRENITDKQNLQTLFRLLVFIGRKEWCKFAKLFPNLSVGDM